MGEYHRNIRQANERSLTWNLPFLWYFMQERILCRFVNAFPVGLLPNDESPRSR